jgi:hypothetical protein
MATGDTRGGKRKATNNANENFLQIIGLRYSQFHSFHWQWIRACMRLKALLRVSYALQRRSAGGRWLRACGDTVSDLVVGIGRTTSHGKFLDGMRA